jgi:quercetin dioxygenase-like cupin family protein
MPLRVERWNAAHPPEPGELGRRLAQEGYRVVEWSDPPGTTYPPHRHPEDQTHWIIRGALALEVEGQTYVLGPGDRDFLPAGTVHAARVTSAEPVVYLIGIR